MDWSKHSVEVAIGSVVVAALIITFLIKNGLIRFGRKDGFVENKFCMHQRETCRMDKKENGDLIHTMKEAIVLQTHIVENHDKKFDKIESKMDSLSCDIKNMWVDVQLLLKEKGVDRDGK